VCVTFSSSAFMKTSLDYPESSPTSLRWTVTL